ncbi:hypothetical protein GOP47_0028489 [Adiantum capillus-veneris]|nr:hypothetical protein GOP47_0028489 [Adiantum capillus-veneris]
MKKCNDGCSCSRQSSSSDGYASKSNGYDSCCSYYDTHLIAKRLTKRNGLHCTRVCIREQGVHVDNSTSISCTEMNCHQGLHQCCTSTKRKRAKYRGHARHCDCSQNHLKRSSCLPKYNCARQKICKHLQCLDCSLKVHDSQYYDFLGLDDARQVQAQHKEEHENKMTRQSNVCTDESTSIRRRLPDLNLRCHLFSEDRCFYGTPKISEDIMTENVAMTNEVLVTTSAKSTGAIQSSGKALQFNAMYGTTLTKCMRAEIMGVDARESVLGASNLSTTQSSLLQESIVSLEAPTKSEGEKAIASATEMEIHSNSKELHSLKASTKTTDKPRIFNIEDANIQNKENIWQSSAGHKTRKKQAVCKISLTELKYDADRVFEQAKDDGSIAKLNDFDGMVSSQNIALAGIEKMATRTVLKQNAFRGFGNRETTAPLGGKEILTEAGLLKMQVTFGPQRWDPHIICALCHHGPSLSLGEWYSGCCGSRLQNCKCRVITAIAGGDEDSFHGKVHKMCALWSIKVANKNGCIEGLSNIVKRGRLSKCARCQKEGATLGCHAATCTQVFHYPCAYMLSSKLRCRMWCGPRFHIACREHQQDTHLGAASSISNKVLKKAQKLAVANASTCSETEELAAEPKNEYKNIVDTTLEISSDSDDVPKINSKASGPSSTDILHSLNEQFSCNGNLPMNEEIAHPSYGSTGKAFYIFGDNIVCDDISGGSEGLPIPCTNDVDTATITHFIYTVRSRYLGRAKRILNSLLSNKENLALPCKGCNLDEIDDPHARVSSHVFLNNGERDCDARIDWQGQPMFGRLPYDRYGRNEVGDEVDIVECSFRCPCGLTCLNRELQKGLKVHLEIFRTETHEWALRTTEALPRGRFVAEFAGEILTHGEAHKRRGECNVSDLRSCSAVHGHLDEYIGDLLVVDWYRMSNIAQFMRKSSKGNLKMHRVYAEIEDPRFYRIGLYASRNIEIGEELSYEGTECFTCKYASINFPFSELRNGDMMTNLREKRPYLALIQLEEQKHLS